MSTILDALKKSEAQRQAQQGSSSNADMTPRRERSNGLLYGMLCVAAILLGIGIFRAGWLDFLVSEDTALVADEQKDDPPMVESGLTDQPAGGRSEPEISPSVDVKPTLQPQLTATMDPPVIEDDRPEAGSTSLAQRRAMLQENAAVEAEPTVSIEKPQAPREVPESPVDDRVAQVVLGDETVEDAAPPVESRRPEPEVDVESLPLVEVLGADSRRMTLIERVVNMQVYSENPDKRFVLIDLRRHVEGDAITEDVVLEKILADSMIVSIDDQRYVWAPRP